MKKFIEEHELFIKTLLALLAVFVIGFSVIQQCFNF